MTILHPRIYVAGPYSAGDVALNIRTALDAADALLGLGCAPYVPHLNHFWHLVHAHAYEEWLDLDLAWLAACEAVWRLPGVSPGADKEVAAAQRLGLPVFLSLAGVQRWRDVERREATP